jgi:hypothetical protein
VATVKTIKSAGGDYTTLALWEDWADGQATTDQWAECYSGFDMGQVVIGSWLEDPDAANYPRIYTNLDQRHSGKDDGSGAYIAVDSAAHGVEIYENFVRVEGIRFVLSSSGRAISADGYNGIYIDSNLITTSGSPTTLVGLRISFSNNATVTFRNNLIYGSTTIPTIGVVFFSYTLYLDVAIMVFIGVKEPVPHLT